MKDEFKTKKQLIGELSKLRQQQNECGMSKYKPEWMKERICESENRFRSVFNAAKDAIFILDPEKDRIIDANIAASELLKYSREELKKTRISTLHPNEMHLMSQVIEETFNKGGIQREDLTCKPKNGDLIPTDISFSPISLGDNQYILAIVRDISERKQAEKALKESEERLRRLYEAAFEGIYISKNGSLLDGNEQLAEMLGYELSELIGINVMDLVAPESKDFVTRQIQEKKDGPYEYTAIRKDRTILPVRVRSKKLADEINKLRVTSIRDLTERKKIEERLRKEREILLEANKELRRAFKKESELREALISAEKLASLGDMACKIAHEINNPLTVIKAQAEIRAQMVEDRDLKESLLVIKEKADQIKHLTRGYMNLARPEKILLKSMQICEVLRTTVRALKPLGQLKNIELSEDYMVDDPKILGDPCLLEQVFRNLIINAVEATSKRTTGKITVGTRLSEDGKCVDAFVTDNGIGIEYRDIEKIFTPYYSKKERTAATGLGLVIVKETIEIIHGGKLQVESQVGEGSKFHVMIPLAKWSRLKKKMIIVDDDLGISGLLSQYFSNKGLIVKTAENGSKAVKILESFSPDLILSDIEMPILDGLELLEEARKRIPNQPFIMMTGFDDRAKAKKQLENMDVPLIMKPPDLEDELWPMVKEKLEIV